jgi:hypothetical protein
VIFLNKFLGWDKLCPTHAGTLAGMNSTAPAPSLLGYLLWNYYGRSRRVTPWPEARFECFEDGVWVAEEPTGESLAAGELQISQAAWRQFLEFVPARQREFLGGFRLARLAALRVMVKCPRLVEVLRETPALTAFIASHANLRGQGAERWNELAAVYGREGVFGVMSWLGLPASRQALAVLRNFADPEVPYRFLEAVRRILWDPPVAWRRDALITDKQVAFFCGALAA